MLACVQRVSSASVTVADETVSEIGVGLLVLLGVGRADTVTQAQWLADKIVGLRIFNDDAGLMNRSLRDVAGEMLIVSQFTLHGDCKKGRRPSFVKAAPPEIAEPLYEQFIELVRDQGIQVGAGVFGGDMEVALTNDGPVTLWLDTER